MSRCRLDMLLAQLEEEKFSLAEMEELASILESSPELRSLAVENLVLTSQLTDLLSEGNQACAAPAEQSAQAMPLAKVDSGCQAGGRQAAWQMRRMGLFGAASVILIAFTVWYAFRNSFMAAQRGLPNERVPQRAVIAVAMPASHAATARLIGQIDCLWHEDRMPPSDGLAVGQELELRAGRAELKFLSGAQVIVQGPARLQVESENGAILQSGIATARVPPEAIGFTLWSPTMAIVDLGTEFGLRVDDRGTTDLQVFQGAVEAEWASGERHESRTLLIDELQAARLNRASGEMVLLPPQQVAIPRLAFTNTESSAPAAAALGHIVADFGREAGDDVVDQYPGQSGLGWATPWNPLSSSKVQSLRTIVSQQPLLGGGAYLSLSHRSSLEGISVQTRVYERRQYLGSSEIALDQPHTISWVWRLDSMAGFDNPRGDYFKCFDSTRFDTVANDEETSWAVIIHPHTTIKFVHEGEKPVRAPLKVVAGHVYEFSVEVDPQRNEYQVGIRQFDPAGGDQLVEECRSPRLPFRNAARNPGRVGGFLHFGPGLDHSDNDATEPEKGTQVAFSLDRIRITPAEGQSK